MTRSSLAVTAHGIRKSFGEHVVLDDVDLEVGQGTIFALLGPNGAGKTTIVRILSTLIRADAGTIQVAGHDLATDPEGVRAAIGVTGQFSAVDNLLTGEENLQLMADLRHLGRAAGRQRVAELLDRFDLTGAARKPLSAYSGGMRRRLDLAMTLVGAPQLIFLDEPTTGLDPRSRRTMWQMRPTSWPARWPCSTTAASSPRAPRTSSSAVSPAGMSSSGSPASTSSARPPRCSRAPPPIPIS
jgi:ABC-2 type transport system ATP-binding protein